MAPSTRTRRAGALLVFFVALAVRLAFWQATPDRVWPGSAAYAGDAATWLAHSASLVGERARLPGADRSEPFAADLPLRPPGNAWLLAALGGGDIGRSKLAWCVLGALVALLVYHAAFAAFGFGVGLATGLLCAGSTALLVLSTSLNNEMPYLLLAMATVALFRPLRDRPAWPRAVAWGALHAAATLVRGEHLLFAALATAALAVAWGRRAEGPVTPRGRGRRRGRRRPTRAGLLVGAAAAYLLVLAPWQIASWGAIHRFNTVTPETAGEQAQRQLEAQLSGVAWAPAAAAERERWPAFARRTAANFVTATVAWRGGRQVDAVDLEVLDRAFGTRPEPLARAPFVALYGGLAFWLANNPAADGGFSRGPLAAPPRLADGRSRYPPPLVAGLPPDDLALAYPPHLAAVNHGWRRGLEWIVAEPAAWSRLVVAKVERFTAGATLGVTGYGVPLGLSGVRRPVDLVVPASGPVATGWRIALILAACVGVASARPRRELVPWLLFAAAQLAVAVAFFGYARLGATVTPCLALLVVLALRRLVPSPSPRRALALAAVAGALLVAVETARAVDRPLLSLDGEVIDHAAPSGPQDHRERRLEVAG